MSLRHLSCSLARISRSSTVASVCNICNNASCRGLASSSSSPLNDTSSSPSREMPTVDVEQLSFLKNPRRGGQNLSQRYRRLERSIRGKTVYGREIQDLERTGKDSDVSPGSGTLVFSSTAAPTRRTFKGFVIPERPKPPADDGLSTLHVPALTPLTLSLVAFRMLHVRLCSVRL